MEYTLCNARPHKKVATLFNSSSPAPQSGDLKLPGLSESSIRLTMTPSLLDGALPLVDADKATEHFLKMMTEFLLKSMSEIIIIPQ
jgi:hypothetical protein